MFKIADKDQDGALSKEEFFKVMRVKQDNDDSSDEEEMLENKQ